MASTRPHPQLTPALVFIGLALATFAAAINSPAGGDQRAATDFASIVAANPADYADYQAKFTWTADQEKSVLTLVLYGSNRTPDRSVFTDDRSPGVHYANDDITDLLAVEALDETFRRLIDDGIGLRPELTIPAADQIAAGLVDPTMSVMIEPGIAPPNQLVFEHLADDIEADLLASILQAAAAGEEAADRETIRRFRNITVGPN